MPSETETTDTPARKTAGGFEREWANWWQGYWSDAPAPRRAPERGRAATYSWRESAHEFDFSGEK